MAFHSAMVDSNDKFWFDDFTDHELQPLLEEFKFNNRQELRAEILRKKSSTLLEKMLKLVQERRENSDQLYISLRREDYVNILKEHFERLAETDRKWIEISLHGFRTKDALLSKFPAETRLKNLQNLCEERGLTPQIWESADSCAAELTQWREKQLWWVESLSLNTLKEIWRIFSNVLQAGPMPRTKLELAKVLQNLKYENMTKSGLKKLCQALELKVTSSAADYFRRITKHFAKMSVGSHTSSKEKADEANESVKTDLKQQEQASADEHSSMQKILKKEEIKELREFRDHWHKVRHTLIPRVTACFEKIRKEVIETDKFMFEGTHKVKGLRKSGVTGETHDECMQYVLDKDFPEGGTTEHIKWCESTTFKIAAEKRWVSKTFDDASITARDALFETFNAYGRSLMEELTRDPDHLCFFYEGGVRKWLREVQFAKRIDPLMKEFFKKNIAGNAKITSFDIFSENGEINFRSVGRNVSRYRPHYHDKALDKDRQSDKRGHNGTFRPDWNGTIVCDLHQFRFALELKFGAHASSTTGQSQDRNALQKTIVECEDYLAPDGSAYDFVLLLIVSTNDKMHPTCLVREKLLNNGRFHYNFITTNKLKELDPSGIVDDASDVIKTELPDADAMSIDETNPSQNELDSVDPDDEVDYLSGDVDQEQELSEPVAQFNIGDADKASATAQVNHDATDRLTLKKLENPEACKNIVQLGGEDSSWYLKFKYANGKNEMDGYSKDYEQAFFEKDDYVDDLLELCRPSHVYLRANNDYMNKHGAKGAAWRLGGGATQVGKTWFKILAALSARQCDVATIVITTTCGGAKELTQKIGTAVSKYPINGSALPTSYYNMKFEDGGLQKEARGGQRDLLHKEIILNSGCLVISNTADQIERVTQVLLDIAGNAQSRKHFILIVDEADEMIRDKDKVQPKFVRKLQELRELRGRSDEFLGPIVNICISATLFPIYLDLAETEKAESTSHEVNERYVHWDKNNRKSYIAVAPEGQYVGLRDFEPMKDGDGNHVYLDENELSSTNLYYSDTVEKFYEDASQHANGLVLDITCPRVFADTYKSRERKGERILNSNFHDKAEFVQCKFPQFVCCTYWGNGHSALYDPLHSFCSKSDDYDNHVRKVCRWQPGCSKEDHKRFESGKIVRNDDESMPKFIARVARNTENARPIAIFGYNMMLRGTTFRSDRSYEHERTPTHIVLAMGSGMSLEKMVQAFGRATFVKNDSAKRNVRVLATKTNIQCAKLYPELMRRIKDLILSGKSLNEIFCEDGPLVDTKWIPFLDLGKKIGYQTHDFVKLGIVPAVEDEILGKIVTSSLFAENRYCTREELEKDIQMLIPESTWGTLTRKGDGTLIARTNSSQVTKVSLNEKASGYKRGMQHASSLSEKETSSSRSESHATSPM